MRKWVAFVVVVAVLAACCIISQPVGADSSAIVVPDDYPTIQQAVDRAAEGAQIYVRNGVYPENVVINKSVMLTGEDWERTIIVGNLSEGGLRPLTITHYNVTVKRMAMVDSWQGVALINVTGCNIVSCKILNNHYGVFLSSGGNNTITGCVFSSAKFGAYGIQLIRSQSNLIRLNQLANLSEGITINDQLLRQYEVVQSRWNNIYDNLIANITDKAIWFYQANNNVLVGNTISNSTIGLALMWADNNEVHGNNFLQNTLQVAGGKEPIFSGGNGIRWSICQWTDNNGGNYWSDYIGADANSNGLGDTPYVINEANSDNKPLMHLKPYPQFSAPASEANFPTKQPTADPTNVPKSEVFSSVQIIAAAITVAVIIAGIIVFTKKGLNKNKQ